MPVEPLSSVIVFCLAVTVPGALALAYALGWFRGWLARDGEVAAGRQALAAQVREATRSYALPPPPASQAARGRA